VKTNEFHNNYMPGRLDGQVQSHMWRKIHIGFMSSIEDSIFAQVDICLVADMKTKMGLTITMPGLRWRQNSAPTTPNFRSLVKWNSWQRIHSLIGEGIRE